MKERYENIVFDLGGVLFNIDYNKTFLDLGSLLGIDLTPGQWPEAFAQLVKKYEVGDINTETFLWNLQRMSTKITPQPYEVIHCWNAMLIGWYRGVMEMLDELSRRYDLYLFSNINELHFQFLERSLRDKGGLDKFNKMFVGACYSHKVGCRKPDSEAFELLVRKYAINPATTLFIDDFKSNVDAAQHAGFQAIHHDGNKPIVKAIISYL